MDKKNYQKPDLQIIQIDIEDIIATSPGKEPGGDDNLTPGGGGSNNNSKRYQNTMGSWNENAI